VLNSTQQTETTIRVAVLRKPSAICLKIQKGKGKRFNRYTLKRFPVSKWMQNKNDIILHIVIFSNSIYNTHLAYVGLPPATHSLLQCRTASRNFQAGPNKKSSKQGERSMFLLDIEHGSAEEGRIYWEELVPLDGID